jgi:hypothetical protein
MKRFLKKAARRLLRRMGKKKLDDTPKRVTQGWAD